MLQANSTAKWFVAGVLSHMYDQFGFNASDILFAEITFEMTYSAKFFMGYRFGLK